MSKHAIEESDLPGIYKLNLASYMGPDGSKFMFLGLQITEDSEDVFYGVERYSKGESQPNLAIRAENLKSAIQDYNDA